MDNQEGDTDATLKPIMSVIVVARSSGSRRQIPERTATSGVCNCNHRMPHAHFENNLMPSLFYDALDHVTKFIVLNLALCAKEKS
jgi:hypothetical protein